MKWSGEWSKENIPLNKNDSIYYESVLEIQPEEWKNKKILDLGAGAKGALAEDLKDRGINAEVVSFSLHYTDKNIAGEQDIPKVAGDVIALPFKDGSFDLVVSVLAIPHYLNSYEEFETVLKEIKRVLKENGEARFWPLSRESISLDGRYVIPIKELNEFAKNSGIEIEIKNPEKGEGWGKGGNEGVDAILVIKKPQMDRKN